MWNSLRPAVRALILLAGGALLLAALLSLIFLTRSDRGLLYFDKLECTPTWPKSSYPLWPVLGPEAESIQMQNTAAIDLWRAVNPKLLIQTDVIGDFEPDPAGIVVIHLMPWDQIADQCPDLPQGHGCTLMTIGDDCLFHLAVMLIPIETPPSKLIRVIAHEYGHMFGFAHDDLQESVMYPKALLTPYKITDPDAILARSLTD